MLAITFSLRHLSRRFIAIAGGFFSNLVYFCYILSFFGLTGKFSRNLEIETAFLDGWSD